MRTAPPGCGSPRCGEGQQDGDDEPAARGIAAEDDLFGGDAAIEHPLVRGHRVVDRRGERVLGGEPVVGDEHAGVGREGERARQWPVAERRSAAVAAAVEMHQPRRVVGPLRDQQRRHPVGVHRRHRHLGRRLEGREHPLVRRALLLEVGVGRHGSGHRLPESRHPLDVFAADRLHGRHRGIDLAQDRAHPIEECVAGDGQLDAMRRAQQQRAAEQLLERTDLPAERRLGDVEALGRPPEVELLGDGNEGAQVAQLDRLRRVRQGDHVLVVGHPSMVTATPRSGDAVHA